jgi:hypothetical protein
MTAENTIPALEPPDGRRFRPDWFLPALLRPRATFARIGSQTVGVWLAPLLLLTVFAVARAVVTGNVQQALMAAGPIEAPPDLPPEQAGQFQQAQSFAANPLFVYVFPSLLAVAGVWIGWLLVGGLLHLLLTLLGGRGSTRSALNVVAWASLPFVVRDLVRIVFMLATRQLITNPGLAGFAPQDGGVLTACAIGVFGQVDLYLIWHIVLIGLGVRASDQLPRAKAWAGAALTVLAIALLRAAPAAIFAMLGAAASGGGPF